MRLNDLAIKALASPLKGEKIYYDDAVTGFGVRVTCAGIKSFILTHGKLRKRETIGRAKVIGLADARAEAKRRLAEYTLGKTLTDSARWDTAVTEYLDDCATRLKPRTVSDYRRFLKRHFRFGTLRLSEVTSSDIVSRLRKLKDTPTEQHHAHVILGTFLTWTFEKHYLDRNPMERITSRFKARKRDRILTDAELVKVWNGALDDAFGHIVKLLILTGQRPGEVSKFCADFYGKDSITLPDWLTKNKLEHTFPIGPMTKKFLPKTRFPMSKRARGETFSSYSRHKAMLDQRCGVTGWTLHDLRRGLRSKWAELGVAREVAEKYINHISGAHSGVEGIYNRYKYWPEQTAAVLKWETHLQILLQD